MTYSTSAIAHAGPANSAAARRALAPTYILAASQPVEWQARAIRSYRQAQRQAMTSLPALLASRVSALTGRSVAPEDVFVDMDTEIATVVVDGVVFRAHDQQVFVLRECAECGIERFESPALYSRADLGYALRGWQPLCHNCQPEDPANWLES
jgi:hypothetical protein